MQVSVFQGRLVSPAVQVRPGSRGVCLPAFVPADAGPAVPQFHLAEVPQSALAAEMAPEQEHGAQDDEGGHEVPAEGQMDVAGCREIGMHAVSVAQVPRSA